MVVPAVSTAWLGIAEAVSARAEHVDAAGRFPQADIAALASAGLLLAPLPAAFGGGDLSDDVVTLGAVLSAVGAASLTVGRLFEGHVNAVFLAARYGAAHHLATLAREAGEARISAVWNAETGGGLVAHRLGGGWRLEGEKIYCSGAGAVVRPLVTARTADGPLMLLPDMRANGIAIDASAWRPLGMRGTVTATVTFDSVAVPDDAVIGGPGDYYRSPWFAGGAWRVLAVQLGGALRAIELHASALEGASRDDPVARARLAEAAGAVEAARLIVAEAARRTRQPGRAHDAIDAYVDLSRGSFERLVLDAITLTRRNVGLRSTIAPNPLDRVLRDLETYLRQPAIDASRDNAARWLLDHHGRLWQ